MTMTDRRITDLLDGIAAERRATERADPAAAHRAERRAARLARERARRDRLRAWVAVCGIVLLLVAAGTSDRASAAEPARCAEDQPCWSWPTMGNRHRGAVGGRVVGPCAFLRLPSAERLNGACRRAPRLRHDSPRARPPGTRPAGGIQ